MDFYRPPHASQEIRGYGAPALLVEESPKMIRFTDFFRSLFSR
jgi:hypothetical protein